MTHYNDAPLIKIGGLNPFLIRAFVQWKVKAALQDVIGLNPFLIRAFVQ